MSVVRPFRGLRPTPGHANDVASPPYDVLDAREAREIVRQRPNSFLRVNKAELEFDDGVDVHSEQVYARGKANLAQLADDGLMARDPKPCFYLYRLTMAGQSQTGLVAVCPVDDYDAGLIKKHEHTRPDKVADRADHIEYLEAQAGPVFCTFRHDERIADIFARITADAPEADFVAGDGIRHELWVVGDDALVADIADAFGALPHIYIADGHHRSEAASVVCRRLRDKNPAHTGEEPYNFFLNVMFPDRELRILPYNRVVGDLNGHTLDDLLERAAEGFDVSPADAMVTPDETHTLGLYCEGKSYTLTARDGSFDPADPTGSIDAAILGANLLAPFLGIDDPKTDERITCVGGIRGTKELVRLVDSGGFRIAFSLHATSIEQLLRVADAGDVMPPKSTWFEPKLRSGMIVNLLTE